MGADLTGCCPCHEDGTPSLVISPEKNLWHCLDAYRAGGSVIDWVTRAERVSFRHAVELLRDGMPAVSAATAPKRSTVRRLASPLDLSAADHELLGQVTDYHHRVLKESADALGYLAKRKIGHPEATDVLRLGYADRTLRLRLPGKRRKDGAEVRSRLEARPSDGVSLIPAGCGELIRMSRSTMPARWHGSWSASAGLLTASP